jgi:multidrug efflux pump subunit AcrA (membrane-fusion protein)
MAMRVERLAWAAGALAVAAAAAGVVPAAKAPTAGRTVPSTRVVRGTLKLDVHATGALRAGRVASLMAPPAGGTLRLVRMADTGSALRAGDVAMEFDPAAQQFALEQANSELAEAEQEIIKMRADVDVRTAQDQVDLLTARFDVRRAELDALTDETLIAAVDRKKRLLALDEAKRRLAQLEEDIQSRSETNRAALAVVDEKRTKARLAAQRAQQIIDSLVVKSPIDGLVVARENRDVTNIFYTGMTLPEYRAGDLVMPGRLVLEVHASGPMEVRVRVSELERANVVEKQAASVLSDALPNEPLAARVSSLAGAASRGGMFDDGLSTMRTFDVGLQLDKPEPRLKPGTSVRVVMAGEELKNVLTLPRQAIFQKNGKPIVYANTGSGFAAREVKVTHRTESRVAVEGVDESMDVALVNPEASAADASAAAGTAPAGGPGR